MAFDVDGAAYQRFMGAFSDLLSAPFADLAGVRAGSGQRAADVGCGTGALSAELVGRLGPGAVVAADPSPSFVTAARERLPGVDVSEAAAEQLPWEDSEFDVTLAQLVVHFMADPGAGLQEMVRVTRPGGVVAATVWDFGGARAPLSTFWRAVRDLDPDAATEDALTGARSGDLGTLLRDAGLRDVGQAELHVSRAYPGFDAWWETYTLGVGPAGDHVAKLDAMARTRLRERCRESLPTGPFTIDAVAWAARGVRRPNGHN